MESQKKLLQKVRLCMHRNILKLALALLLIGLILVLTASVFISPIVATILFGNLNGGALLGFSLFAIGIKTITYVLLYGFFGLMLLLYRGQKATLGALFAGFRDFKRAFFVGLIFTIIAITVIGFFSVVSNFGMLSIFAVSGMPILYRDHMVFVLAFVLAIVLIVLVIMYIRYGFVWFILHDQPDLKVRAALKQSALVTKGKRLSFLLFSIRNAGLFLLGGVLTFIAMQVLPPSTDANSISPILYIVSSLVNVIYLLCAYASIIRVCLGFAAWYEAHSAVCVAPAIDSTVQD